MNGSTYSIYYQGLLTDRRYNMTEKEKQQAINKAAWNEFEKTGDFSALLDIRFIISDNVKKELKGKENAIQKV